MSYDPRVQNLRCPYCDSEKLHAEDDVRVLAPTAVVPFRIAQQEALAELQHFLGKGWWRPSDLRNASQVTKLTAVYVPYWVFSATVHTCWTADSSETPPHAQAAWYPVSGFGSTQYEGVLVGASGTLKPSETAAICPFDLSAGIAPELADLEHALYEPFRVQKKYARPQAIAGFEELERAARAKEVPGRSRNVRVNLRLEGLHGYPALLPVWIMAYQYREETFRFLVNGQTGRSTGQAPISYYKLTGFVATAVALSILLLLLLALCSGIAS
jgi:hypothetical protein